MPILGCGGQAVAVDLVERHGGGKVVEQHPTVTGGWGAPKAAPFPRGPIYQPFAGADFLGEIGEILGLYDNFGAVDLGPGISGEFMPAWGWFQMRSRKLRPMKSGV